MQALLKSLVVNLFAGNISHFPSPSLGALRCAEASNLNTRGQPRGLYSMSACQCLRPFVSAVKKMQKDLEKKENEAQAPNPTPRRGKVKAEEPPVKKKRGS